MKHDFHAPTNLAFLLPSLPGKTLVKLQIAQRL
jgi:hypothetical protein